MLAELHIRNFALIERQRVPLGPGFCAISGGTGAGKSLVVDALKFVLGARGSPDVIRPGEPEAEVEALFYVDAPGERARVASAIPSLAESSSSWEGELVLTRSISRAGRSRATVNGRLVTVGALEELGSRLVEVCGQHETQALFRAADQRELVDLFGSLAALRERYRRAYDAHRAEESRLRALEGGRRDRSARIERLEFEVRELRALKPAKGELEALEAELVRLESAARVRSALRTAYVGIYESESAVLAKLRASLREIEPLRAIVPELDRVAKIIEEASGGLEEAALTCRDLRSSYRFDEDRREEVDERISQVRRASVKCGLEADRLPAHLSELEAELRSLQGSTEDEASVRAECARLEGELARLGAELTAARRTAGERLGREVTVELADLGMSGAELTVDVAPDPQGAGPSGVDRVELLVRTNPDHEPHPLRKIASGGEASRVMLALKARLAGEGSVPTLFFDEVDANVGGRLGTTIGRRLRALAQRYQVLCVTHLPQVAAFADRHLAVAKSTEGGRTATSVTELDDDGRVREIAQMIRGEAATEATVAEARGMLEAARTPSSGTSHPQAQKAGAKKARA